MNNPVLSITDLLYPKIAGDCKKEIIINKVPTDLSMGSSINAVENKNQKTTDLQEEFLCTGLDHYFSTPTSIF